MQFLFELDKKNDERIKITLNKCLAIKRLRITNTMEEYKVLLVGDGGVGKSCLVERMKKLPFTKQYIPTMGVDVHAVSVETDTGRVILKVWDCAGQEKFGKMRERYYVDADAAILMYDHTSRITLKNVDNWKRDVERINPTIKTIVCANKKDIEDSKTNNITLPEKVFHISTRSGENVDSTIDCLIHYLRTDQK